MSLTAALATDSFLPVTKKFEAASTSHAQRRVFAGGRQDHSPATTDETAGVVLPSFTFAASSASACDVGNGYVQMSMMTLLHAAS